MPRTVRDAKLETRAARLRLAPRAEPYWRGINEGAHLGYYRGARGGKWVARFRKPGSAGYLKQTLGIADDVSDADGEAILDYRQAQEKARKWFSIAARGGHRAGRYTVADALDEYMAGFRGKSVVATRSRVEAIIKPELGHLQVADLTQRDVAGWHHRRAQSPARLRTSRFATERNLRPLEGDEAIRRRRSTANRDLTVLKAALNRALENRPDLPADAWRKVKPFPKVEGVKLRYLSDEEVRKLVNAATADIRPLIQGALLTGARYGELRAVRTRDFDPQAATLRLNETKSGIARNVYLEEEGVRLLKQLTVGKRGDDFIFVRPDGQPWGIGHQARRLAAASAAAKLEHTGFHDLRRTYGARLAIQGVPMAVIAEALGHADERITRRHYAHLSPSYVANTVRAHAAGLGIVLETKALRVLAGGGC